MSAIYADLAEFRSSDGFTKKEKGKGKEKEKEKGKERKRKRKSTMQY